MMTNLPVEALVLELAEKYDCFVSDRIFRADLEVLTRPKVLASINKEKKDMAQAKKYNQDTPSITLTICKACSRYRGQSTSSRKESPSSCEQSTSQAMKRAGL